MSEDDQLAEQAEREHLHAQHDQQRAQQQRGSIGELLVEEQTLHAQERDDGRADAERRGAEHAEEAQRPLGEAHQEEDAEQIEHMVRIFLGAIHALQAILGRLAHGHFADAKAEACRQDGHEAMLVAVQVHFFEHLAAHGARSAAEVLQPGAGDEVHQPVKGAATHAIEQVAVAGRAIADGHVRGAQCRHQLGNVLRLDLVIGRQCDDHAALSALEAGHQRRGFAEAARQADDREVLAVVQQLFERAAGVRAVAVDHENELERQADGFDAGLVLRIQGPQLRASPAYGHDDGDRRQ